MRHLRPALLAAAMLAPIFARAEDLKAAEEALVGDWWEENYRDAFELRADRTGTRHLHSEGKAIAGTWSVPAAGKFRFAPDDGTEPIQWSVEVRDGRMAVPIIGDPRVYVREARADRTARLAEVLKRCHDLDRAIAATRWGETHDRGALIALRRIDAEREGLLLTLAGPEAKEQEAFVEELAKDRADLRRVLEKGGRKGHPVACKNNLKMIGVYVALYESKFKKYPRGFDDLWRPDLMQDKKVLRCPVTGTENAYELLEPSDGDNTPPDEIIAYDRTAHADGSRCVLMFQGRVATYDEEAFKEAKEKGRTEGIKSVEESD